MKCQLFSIDIKLYIRNRWKNRNVDKYVIYDYHHLTNIKVCTVMSQPKLASYFSIITQIYLGTDCEYAMNGR